VHGKAIGHAVAQLYAEQQTRCADAAAGVSVGTEGDHPPARFDRVLGPSGHPLLCTKELSKGFLLDLPARGPAAEA